MNTPPDVPRILESLETNQRALESSIRGQRRVILGTLCLCCALVAAVAFLITQGRGGQGALRTDARGEVAASKDDAPETASPGDPPSAASSVEVKTPAVSPVALAEHGGNPASASRQKAAPATPEAEL